MLDLFRSRDKAVRYFLIFLLGLVALSMVTYLIPNTGTGAVAGDEAVVAQIGSDKITAQEVTRTIQRMTQSRQLPAELLSVYVPQVIQQMINERAMAWKAADMGMKVSTEDAENSIIDSIPAEYVKNGKVDPAMLSAVLQQQGSTLADLRASTQRDLLMQRLETLIAGGVVVSPLEVEKEFRHRNDKVKIQYAILAGSAFTKESTPTDAEVADYYNANKQSFQIPEKRNVAIVVLDPARVGAGIQASDDQLRADYNNRQADFQTPERVKARHILLKSDATNDAAIKVKAEALLKQIQGGGDFAALAKEKSEDPGSGAQGGELGFIVKGQTVPEFEKAAFSLKPGEISGLVKTTYGYHIIQTEAHEQARLTPFEEVKPQLTADYQKRAAAQLMQSLADKAAAALRQDPANPEKAAAAVGGTLVRAANITATGNEPIPGIGVSKELGTAVSALRKSEVTLGPVVMPDGRALIAEVTDVLPAHQATLDEVSADVHTRAAAAKLQKVIASKAAELAAKTQAMGGDLEKAAKSMSIEVKMSNDVNRQDAIEGVGTAGSVADLFTKPVGSIIGPTSATGGQLIAKIVSNTPASLSDLAAQQTKIMDELHSQKTRDRATFFQHGLRESLTANGKLKVHQDVIDRLVASYRQRAS